MTSLFSKIIPAAVLVMILSLGFSSGSVAYPPAVKPDIYVVMFRADWCAPCKVVEPRLNQALAGLHDPAIEYVNIDISGGQGDWNSHAVFDRQIVPQYNMWLGITGFAAIIDADTKRTLGCVNMNYNAEAMQIHIRNLKRLALKNQPNTDLTCPGANNPV
jgi:thiol-disulfide isomerase/thioredoxin